MTKRELRLIWEMGWPMFIPFMALVILGLYMICVGES